MKDNSKTRDRKSNDDMFRNELEIIALMRENLADDSLTKERLLREYHDLGGKYEKLVKEVKKITRVGDMNHHKLMSANDQIQIQKNELEDLNKELRSANAAKDKLYSIIAHDLMNPLGFLLFSSDLLEKMQPHNDQGEGRLRKYAEKVFTTAQNMSELLENLLQWSRSQYGEITCKQEVVDISKVAHDSVDYFMQNAKRKYIDLVCNIPAETMVFVDENMIRCVLRNLVGNALKFTRPQGNVHLSAERREGFLVVSVRDNGIGIKKEKLDTLFNLGENVSTQGTEKEKGSGLGLILCKEFIEKNKGKIVVQSEIDKGSTFEVFLPEVSEQKAGIDK